MLEASFAVADFEVMLTSSQMFSVEVMLKLSDVKANVVASTEMSQCVAVRLNGKLKLNDVEGNSMVLQEM